MNFKLVCRYPSNKGAKTGRKVVGYFICEEDVLKAYLILKHRNEENRYYIYHYIKPHWTLIANNDFVF